MISILITVEFILHLHIIVFSWFYCVIFEQIGNAIFYKDITAMGIKMLMALENLSSITRLVHHEALCFHKIFLCTLNFQFISFHVRMLMINEK